MTKSGTTRITMEELDAMDKRGEIPPLDPSAQPGPDLGDEFWENAVLVDYREPTSVHLKLDPLVFAWFKQQGKGHLTRMQDVLKAYVRAEMRKRRTKTERPHAAE